MRSRWEFARQRGVGRGGVLGRGMRLHGLFMERVVLDGWNRGNIRRVVMTVLRTRCSFQSDGAGRTLRTDGLGGRGRCQMR